MDQARCVVGVGDRERTVDATPPALLHRPRRPTRPLSRWPGGPGAVVIDGLDPSTRYDVWVGTATGRRVVGQLITLPAPPGRLLARFASVSDLHIGERSFGFTSRIREGPELGGTSAVVCLEAALIEARAWGAQMITARGDLTRSSRPDQFELAARTLARAGVPAAGVLGNHDLRLLVDGAAISASHGVPIATDATAYDLPGIRIVLAHSPMATDHRGDLPPVRIARIAELCATAPPSPGAIPNSGAQSRRPGPAAVILHHPLSRYRFLSAYPPGVPVGQSTQLTSALRAANPSTLLLVGHRHRNRRRIVGGLTVAELGSTKDYPGSWAGYAVYEGGIRQVIRRVADPSAMAWTEATGRALGGQWARWAPGTLNDRCWVMEWAR